jgi:hypothetical protein
MNPKVATAIVVLALVIMAGVPARTDASSTSQAQTDLSSLPKIEAYLGTMGIDLGSVVVQQGQLNYAGPNCPGAGWNCTTASMVVQMTTSTSPAANIFDCAPAVNVTVLTLGECVIVQSSVSSPTETANTTNSATCASIDEGPGKSKCKIKQSSKKGNNFAEMRARTTQNGGASQSATQTYEINQESESGNNTARITQEITQSMVQGSQAASQDAIVNQVSVSGTNDSAVSQLIMQNQSTAFAGPSVTQGQEAHQTVRVCQGGTLDQPCANTAANPRNISGVAQKNLQSATVRFDEGDSGTIIQEQNAQTSGGPSSQTLVRQNSQGRSNDAKLNQFGRATALVLNHNDHDDDNNGNGTDGFSGSVTQRQGNGTSPCTNSGLCGFEFQDSTGVQKAFESQDEALRMRAPHQNLPMIGVTQEQHGPFYCCATQTGGNNANVNEILQTKSVLASGTIQSAYVQAHCASPSGDMDNCTAKQFVTVQGEPQPPNTCTGSNCNIATSCTTVEGTTQCQQVEEPPSPPCPPDQPECFLLFRAGAVVWRDDGLATT